MTQSASQSDTILTLEEYLTYEDGTDNRYELVDGELVKMPPESLENCDVAMRLLFQLAKFLPLTWLSYKDIEIEVSGRRAKTRLPDLMVLGEECRHALEGKTRGTITRDMPPPLVAIEIVSPGHANEVRDYRYKRSEYAARGILSYWIVDPQQHKVTVLSLVEGLYEETVYQNSDSIICPILPDIQIRVTDILENPLS
jgi:Uma2 family endonuclease